MVIYASYSELVQSNLFDYFIRDYFTGSLVLFSFFQGSFIPLLSLQFRVNLTHFYFRMIMIWMTIFYTIYAETYYWTSLLCLIELLRGLLIIGVPLAFKYFSEDLPRDPIAETMLKQLFILMKKVHRQDVFKSLVELRIIQEKYRQGDTSKKWTPDERETIQRFFHEFVQSCFVWDTGLTVFFSTFVLHYDNEELHLTSVDLKLKPVISEEICAICQDIIQEYALQLKCQHQYCLKCIYSWLNQEYTCPLCRQELS